MKSTEAKVKPFIGLDWEMLRLTHAIALLRGWRIDFDSTPPNLSNAFISREQAWDRFNNSFFSREHNEEDKCLNPGELALGCSECQIYNQFMMRPYLVSADEERGVVKVSCHGLNMKFWDGNNRVLPACVDSLSADSRIIFNSGEEE